AFATVYETLHRPPSIEQSDAAIVDDIAVLISRILVVARLKRKWSVNEVEIQIVEAESFQTRFEGRLHAFRPMIGVPQFCCDEDILARDPSGGKSCAQRLAHVAFVAVSFGTIEVSKPSFQRVFGRAHRHGWIGNEGAKPEHGHLACSVVERQSRSPKVRRFDHDDTSAIYRVQHHRSDKPSSRRQRRAGLSEAITSTYRGT